MSRQKHWDKVYSEKGPHEVSWFLEDPALSLSMIKATGISKDAAIIDVGGGASRLVDHLEEAGYHNLAVLDISSQAIEHAKSRLGSRQDQVEWFVDDITHFKPTRKFDLWHDRAVFHFLINADDREKYLANLEQGLVKDAHLIIATFDIGGPEKCSGLDIEQYDEAKIVATLGNHFKLLEVQHELHITPADKQQQFNYFHFKKII